MVCSLPPTVLFPTFYNVGPYVSSICSTQLYKFFIDVVWFCSFWPNISVPVVEGTCSTVLTVLFHQCFVPLLWFYFLFHLVPFCSQGLFSAPTVLFPTFYNFGPFINSICSTQLYKFFMDVVWFCSFWPNIFVPVVEATCSTVLTVLFHQCFVPLLWFYFLFRLVPFAAMVCSLRPTVLLPTFYSFGPSVGVTCSTLFMFSFMVFYLIFCSPF
jgi:hypothetical protein